MTTYYRVSDAELRELTAEQFAALASNKRSDLRLYIVDPQPTPTSLRIVIDNGIVIGEVEAHKSWGLRDKTPEELADEQATADIAAERQQIVERIDSLTAAIAQYQALLDVPYAEPAQAGTNAAEITAIRERLRVQERGARDIWRDLIGTMRSARFLLRAEKRR